MQVLIVVALGITTILFPEIVNLIDLLHILFDIEDNVSFVEYDVRVDIFQCLKGRCNLMSFMIGFILMSF